MPAPDRPIICDSLMPRWGKGTEFRMVRQGDYKYIRFRNAPPLAFDLKADPGEQCNLLQREGGVPEPVGHLARFAAETMDFDEAERERVERDGQLDAQYALSITRHVGNLRVMPSGAVIAADEALYDPTIIAASLADMCGEDWARQNALRKP